VGAGRTYVTHRSAQRERLDDVIVHLLIDLILGAVFGFAGGLFGIGGGVIAIPVLGLFFGMSEQVAQGTALVMVVPNVMIGLWHYYKHGTLNVRYALTLGASAVPFTFVGAQIATHLPSAPLRVAFGVFTLCIAAYTIYRTLGPRAVQRAALPWYLASIVGAIGGTLSGFFSVGGATFAVPAMAIFFGMSQAAAQSMGLALVAPGTFVGLATYGLAHDVDWVTGITLAIGGAGAVSYGVDVAHNIPERSLKLLFAAFLFAAGLGLLLAAR
jgi:uncharacterized membrane protein YfcA